MQVSNEQIERILSRRGDVVADLQKWLAGIDEPEFTIDDELIQLVVRRVAELPDREDRIADLKARIESGAYNPTSAEIVDAMIRRAIADSVR